MNHLKQVKIGILGGMSTVATSEYYKLINNYVRDYLGGFETAEMIISSVNFGVIEKFVRNEDWHSASAYLTKKALELQSAGVASLFLATNTMHIVREEIKKAIDIPFIDIFETTAFEIKKNNISTAGLLGTYPVMSDPFYKNTFEDYGIEIIRPEEDDKHIINRIIFNELTKNKFKESSKNKFLEVIQQLNAEGAQAVILGCTEIKLLINQSDIPNVPLFDTTTLHCQRAARICTGQEKI